MINPDQIRAARALLDWKLSDLAKLTGLTVNGISLIERGEVQGRHDSLESIQKAFEEAGIEFIPGSGVRKKDRIIEVYEGKDASKLLIEDIYNTLKDTGGEMLVAHLSEDVAASDLSREFILEQIRKRKAAGITNRLLVREDDPGLIPPYDTYHALPKEFFSPYPFYIYGPKIALLSRQYAPKAIIINDERFAESIKKLFDFVWSQTKVPSPRKGGQ